MALRNSQKLTAFAVWWAFFLAALAPFVVSIVQVAILQTGGDNYLGSEPGKTLVDRFAQVALWCLLITLAISPLRRRLHIKWLVGFRRQIGLFCFFYASLHLLSYATFLLQWDWVILSEDLIERPYIYVGMLAWIGLLVLALTSPKWVLRKMKQHWLTLHKSIYLIALLIIVHEWMQVRASIFEVLLHTLLLSVLLLERLLFYWQKRRKTLAK